MYKIFSNKKNDNSIVWDGATNAVLFEFVNGECATYDNYVAKAAQNLGFRVENTSQCQSRQVAEQKPTSNDAMWPRVGKKTKGKINGPAKGSRFS